MLSLREKLLAITRGELAPMDVAERAGLAVWALVTTPRRLRGCAHVGSRPRVLGGLSIGQPHAVELGDDLVIDGRLAPVALEGPVRVGDRVFLNFGVRLFGDAGIVLGDHVDLGPHCELDASRGPIAVGNDVWLGARVRVRPGARIGAGTVVAAGAVVEGELPPGCVAGGRPARVLRYTGGRGASLSADKGPPLPEAQAPARQTFALTGPPQPPAASARSSWRALGADSRVYGRPKISNRGKMVLGARLECHSAPVQTHLVTGPRATLVLGDDVSIGPGAGIAAHSRIEVGDGSVLGPGAMLLDFDFHGVELRENPSPPKPISIGRGVRIGARALVLSGVTVGDGAQIGDDSVVVRDVPAGAWVCGAPARPV